MANCMSATEILLNVNENDEKQYLCGLSFLGVLWISHRDVFPRNSSDSRLQENLVQAFGS